MKFPRMFVCAFVFTLLPQFACDETVTIQSGTYEPAKDQGEIPDVLLYIDMSDGAGMFLYPNGEEVVFEIEKTEESEWETGCHTQMDSVTEEIAKTNLEILVLGEIELESPVLRASCGGDSNLWVASANSGGGGASFVKIGSEVAP